MVDHYSKKEQTPLISIITPVFNRVDMVGQAIESVLHQEYVPVEHIIMDGGSTDGTLDVLAKYSHLKVVSGQDQGMYDALNKGLDLAAGEIIGFLNSDDLYAENVFSEIGLKFLNDDVLAVAGGAVVFSLQPDRTVDILRRFSPGRIDLLELSTTGSPFFNAWFFRKSVFEKLGKFNDRYRIAADRDFMLRLAISNVSYATVNETVYQYRHHEGSMTFDLNTEKLEKIVREHVRITESYLHQATLPMNARRLLIKASTQNTMHLAIYAIENRQFSKFFSSMFNGLRYDGLWLYKFMQYVIHHPYIFRGFFMWRAS